MPMKLMRLVVIGLVLFISSAFGQAGKAVQVPSKTVNAQAPIRLTPTLQAADFEWGNINGKGYKLSVEIENTSNEEMQLGDALFLWEIGPEETWNSVVLQLEKPEMPKKTEQVSFRYVAKEQHMISPDGSTTIAAGGSGGFSATTTKLCRLGESDKGFGLVAAGGKRTFSWDLPMPVFTDKKVVSSVWVSIPELRFSASGRTWAPWIEYAPDGDTLKLQAMHFLLLNTNQLRSAFQGADLLLRLLASAKLAEGDPQSAEPLLVGAFGTEKALIVKCAIAGNLGWMGSKAAARSLLAVLDSAHGFFFETVMNALGQIHLDETMPALLKQLNRTDYSELYFTIDTLAKINDPQVIPALEEFRKQIKQLPLSSRQKDNLEYQVKEGINARTGSMEKTKRSPEATESVRPTANSYYNQGATYVNSGRSSEALKSFRKALEIDPHNALAQYQLAVTLLSLGSIEDAERELKNYLALGPKDPKLAESVLEELANSYKFIDWTTEERVVPSESSLVVITSERLITNMVKPIYPVIARNTRVAGSVVVRVIVDSAGYVVKIHIVSGHPLLRRPSIDAVKQWRFSPYKENGEFKPFIYTLRLGFTLDASSSR